MDARTSRKVIFRTAVVILVVAAVVSVVWPPAPEKRAPARPISFTEVTEAAGIRMEIVHGESQRKYIIEAKGSGVAFLDYNGDGWDDLYVINGASHREGRIVEVAENKLFRNNRDGTFTDVTARAGVGHRGWGRGCAVGDYDSDGDLDLYVTNYGPNVLYRNNGDETFTDVTAEAGVREDRWSMSAGFLDHDRDGDLDLYVTNYLEFDLSSPPYHDAWYVWRGIRGCYGPGGLKPVPDRFFRNNGNGTFTDSTRETGLGAVRSAYGLGLSFADYDSDGWVDIYVANDSAPNFLFHNNHDGTFREVGIEMGVALGSDGHEQAGMGTDFADYNNDGMPDIVAANFSHDWNNLYRNEGVGFLDVSARANIRLASFPFLSFAARFLDLDNDGDRDIFFANGHVYPEVDSADTGTTFAQRNHIFENVDLETFREIGEELGPGFALARPSRGACFSDYDGDGDIDLFVVNISGSPNLLRNDGGNQNHWIQFRLRSPEGNRDGIGARITVRSDDLRQIYEVFPTSSFCSQSSLIAHFGLGDRSRADAVEIRWPDGSVEELGAIEADHLYLVEKGAAPAPVR